MVYTVRSWILGKRMVSVPLASYVDPLVTESTHLLALANFVARARREERCKSVEIRLLKTVGADSSDGVTQPERFKHCATGNIGNRVNREHG